MHAVDAHGIQPPARVWFAAMTWKLTLISGWLTAFVLACLITLRNLSSWAALRAAVISEPHFLPAWLREEVLSGFCSPATKESPLMNAKMTEAVENFIVGCIGRGTAVLLGGFARKAVLQGLLGRTDGMGRTT